MKKYVTAIFVPLIAIVGCSPSLESQCSQISPIVFTNPPPFTGKNSSNVDFYKEKADKLQQITVNDPKLKAIQTRLIDSSRNAAEVTGNPTKVTAQKLQKSFADDLALLQEFVNVCPKKK
jgi:hypothetical protein